MNFTRRRFIQVTGSSMLLLFSGARSWMPCKLTTKEILSKVRFQMLCHDNTIEVLKLDRCVMFDDGHIELDASYKPNRSFQLSRFLLIHPNGQVMGQSEWKGYKVTPNDFLTMTWRIGVTKSNKATWSSDGLLVVRSIEWSDKILDSDPDLSHYFPTEIA